MITDENFSINKDQSPFIKKGNQNGDFVLNGNVKNSINEKTKIDKTGKSNAVNMVSNELNDTTPTNLLSENKTKHINQSNVFVFNINRGDQEKNAEAVKKEGLEKAEASKKNARWAVVTSLITLLGYIGVAAGLITVLGTPIINVIFSGIAVSTVVAAATLAYRLYLYKSENRENKELKEQTQNQEQFLKDKAKNFDGGFDIKMVDESEIEEANRSKVKYIAITWSMLENANANAILVKVG